MEDQHPVSPRGGQGGSGGILTVKSGRQARLRTRLKVKNTRGVFKGCCTVLEGHKRPKRGPRGSGGVPEGFRRGSGGVPEGFRRGSGGVPEGFRRLSKGLRGGLDGRSRRGVLRVLLIIISRLSAAHA
eukprot:399938-Prorocentrum_minimum.AAC.1